MIEIILGTKNQYKRQLMEWYLKGLKVVSHDLSLLAQPIVVEETEPTIIGNAIKKARQISDATDLYVLASDTDVLNPDPIPPYAWMGHLWYYPHLRKTYNQLAPNRIERMRIANHASLRHSLQNYLKSLPKY